jgi:hypothetical protein
LELNNQKYDFIKRLPVNCSIKRDEIPKFKNAISENETNKTVINIISLIFCEINSVSKSSPL